jgi:protein O-GlcNAc transferase
MSPAFQHLFAPGDSILRHKSLPPTIAYTSTPFRGLEILLQVFPEIRRRIPDVTLLVFSSMRIYLAARLADEQQYGKLYAACRSTRGVQYVGSIPQPDLARTLRAVSVLAYPNIFEETSCIALIEAMAAGCRVITTDLAALPETAAGHAHLIPPPANTRAYKQHFIEAVVTTLDAQRQKPAEEDAHRRQQVEYFNKEYTWSHRAAQWLEFLQNLPPRP